MYRHRDVLQRGTTQQVTMKYEKDCDTDTGFEGNSGVNSKETRTGRFY